MRVLLLASLLTALAAAPPRNQPPNKPLHWNCVEGNRAMVIWQRPIGTWSGSPAIHGDKILLGSSTFLWEEFKDLPTGGLFTCLRKSDGALIWKLHHPQLPKRVNDMTHSICSQPAIDGNRVYYVSNRGELMCLDIEGFRDNENDGPFSQETATGLQDADIIWKIDMMRELGVFKRDAGDIGNLMPGVLVSGNLVFCLTTNGIDEHIEEVPKPNAPSFLAADKLTGKIAWTSAAPGKEISWGQWSTPVLVTVDGKEQVIFPGGDGRLYAFEPTTGKLLWKVLLHWPEWPNVFPRHAFNAPPTVVGDKLYVGTGLTWEHNTRSPLYCVDLRCGEIDWLFAPDQFAGTDGSVAVSNGVAYVLAGDSVFFALDANTGKELWRSEPPRHPSSVASASPLLHDNLVYVGNCEEFLLVYAAGRTPRLIGRYELDHQVILAPHIDGDRLYVTTCSSLWCLRLPPK